MTYCDIEISSSGSVPEGPRAASEAAPGNGGVIPCNSFIPIITRRILPHHEAPKLSSLSYFPWLLSHRSLSLSLCQFLFSLETNFL